MRLDHGYKSRVVRPLLALFCVLTAVVPACRTLDSEPGADAGPIGEPDAASAAPDGASVAPEAGLAAVCPNAPHADHDAGPPHACPDPAAAMCNDSGWCWTNPLPQGMDLGATWGSSATDVWAAGAGGTMLHWDGCDWTASAGFAMNDSGPRATFASSDIRGIWGSCANDVWAVGNGVFHWDGAAWVQTIGDASPPLSVLSSVWGSSANDVWTAGDGIFHWNGASWTPAVHEAGIPFKDIRGIWGSSAKDVWAVGGGASYILHWDGRLWSLAWQGHCYKNACALQGIWGSGANDVWAVGGGSLLRWDGHAWTETRSETLGNATAIWGSGANDVWLTSVPTDARDVMQVMEHWDGVAWTSSPGVTSNGDTAIWGANGSVWVVGRGGSIERHR